MAVSLNIIDFPDKEDGGVKVFGPSSYENAVAVLSHKLHSLQQKKEYVSEDKSEIIQIINEFLRYKGEDVSMDEVAMVAEDPFTSSLFNDFFETPFQTVSKPEYTFIDLFAGIGGIRIPFTELGYGCVFSSEWDAKAQKTYFANFGEMPFGDITQERVKSYIPNSFDVLLAGFPCQAFSIMGKMRGFEDVRGTLFFEVASILKKHRPNAFLLENVKQLVSHDSGRTFETIQRVLSELGYYFKWRILNALDFGLPQKRERVIIVGFLNKAACEEFDFDFKKVPYDLRKVLEDDSHVDPSYFASAAIIEKRKEKTQGKRLFYPSVWHENKSQNISVLDYACALRTGASYNYLLINGIRRPTSRELLRFQGFPDKYRIVVSNSDIRRQTGNSVAVPMIRAVAQKINNILLKYYPK